MPDSNNVWPRCEGSRELPDLPVIDGEVPAYHRQPVADVLACNFAYMREQVYDEKYFADSLRRKVRVPFVI